VAFTRAVGVSPARYARDIQVSPEMAAEEFAGAIASPTHGGAFTLSLLSRLDPMSAIAETASPVQKPTPASLKGCGRAPAKNNFRCSLF
jgi:hypothetical protein